MSEILVKNEGNMDEDLNLSKHQLNLACEIKAPMQADARGLRSSVHLDSIVHVIIPELFFCKSVRSLHIAIFEFNRICRHGC